MEEKIDRRTKGSIIPEPLRQCVLVDVFMRTICFFKIAALNVGFEVKLIDPVLSIVHSITPFLYLGAPPNFIIFDLISLR
jgi:hypothetical protein